MFWQKKKIARNCRLNNTIISAERKTVSDVYHLYLKPQIYHDKQYVSQQRVDTYRHQVVLEWILTDVPL